MQKIRAASLKVCLFSKNRPGYDLDFPKQGDQKELLGFFYSTGRVLEQESHGQNPKRNKYRLDEIGCIDSRRNLILPLRNFSRGREIGDHGDATLEHCPCLSRYACSIIAH